MKSVIDNVKVERESRSEDFAAARMLSPRRNTTRATSIEELAHEQLEHFGIDPESDYGRSLQDTVENLYQAQSDLNRLWQITLETIDGLDKKDRLAYFNAKKFLSFQLAKLLDTLQHPFRRTYQSLDYGHRTQSAKGPYPIFDNVTAVFSATPVIARTATYIYACTEWIADAFKGKELLLEIYSRLMNPTSVSLANYIVELEAGPYSRDYFAWNFNSGMAAIDGVLSHLLGREDVLITNRHMYGGTHQLIHDWFAKPSNLGVAVAAFDGYGAGDFEAAWNKVRAEHAERFRAGRRAYLYLESPCNPHGYFLDVPRICKRAHEEGLRVIVDSTVATPFLSRPLQRDDPAERPDFVIHSYTKDLSGSGSTIAGVVIGRNEDMFLPKGETVNGVSWNETMFWNVYYVKGAFLPADGAFEVIQGMRTLENRMLAKCINTDILARALDSHPMIGVHSSALPGDENSRLREETSFLGLPAPLFTIEMPDVPPQAFKQFFDLLEPTFAHMISLGQPNTIVNCPALTSHSELDEAALAAAGIGPTTIRIATGDEDPIDLMSHFIEAARMAIDPAIPGFAEKFMPLAEIEALIEDRYLEIHGRYIRSRRQSAR